MLRAPLGFNCGDLLQFFSMGFTEAACVGTVQKRIRRRGEGSLTRLPVIQRILQRSTDGPCPFYASVRMIGRGGNRWQLGQDGLRCLREERKLLSILRSKRSDETRD